MASVSKIDWSLHVCPENWCNGTGIIQAYSGNQGPNYGTILIEACDFCERFKSDNEAEEFVNSLL